MTNSAPRPSKNERREAAREKARLLRQEQKKREKRNRLFLVGGLSFAGLAVLGLIALIILPSVFRAPAQGPANMATNGAYFTSDLVAAAAPSRLSNAAPADPQPAADGVVDIRIWVDYMCPYCGAFEATNAEQIKGWVQDGSATLELHPISILDRASQGSRYSTRAANAMACVTDQAPASAFDFSAVLFQNQPAENTAGLDNAKLIELAAGVGASGDAIEKCINDGQFAAWVQDATTYAGSNPVPGSDVTAVTTTPTVVVNGVKYTGPVDNAKDFASFVLARTGEGSANSTPTPTPTPSATQ